MGGIYLADIAPSSALTTLVMIGDPVPGGSAADRFTGFGESLSFDGRYGGGRHPSRRKPPCNRHSCRCRAGLTGGGRPLRPSVGAGLLQGVRRRSRRSQLLSG